MQNIPYQQPQPPMFDEDDECPRLHTLNWLFLQSVFTLVLSGVLSIVSAGISSLASGRHAGHLLLKSDYEMVTGSMAYCFALYMLTIFSLMLIEISFRKRVNYVQYGLIGCALCLFYLLLLAMTEFIDFWLAYSIVSVMIIGLISLYIKGITGCMKAVWMTVGLLLAEYIIVAILVKMGTLALLVGSLLLFVIIAVAMYITLRMKVVDGELTIKK